MKKILCVVIITLVITLCSCDNHRHNYSTEVERVDPTCELSGYVIMKCECGLTNRTDYAPKHQLEYTVIKEATCTVNGKTHIRCTVCGYSYDEETTKSHTYDASKRCTMCGKLREGKIKLDYNSYSDYNYFGTSFSITSMDYTKYIDGIAVTLTVRKRSDKEKSASNGNICFYVSVKQGSTVIDTKTVFVLGLSNGESKTETVPFRFNYDYTEDYTITIKEIN